MENGATQSLLHGAYHKNRGAASNGTVSARFFADVWFSGGLCVLFSFPGAKTWMGREVNVIQFFSLVPQVLFLVCRLCQDNNFFGNLINIYLFHDF